MLVKHVAGAEAVAEAVAVTAGAAAGSAVVPGVPFPSSRVDAAFGSCSCSWPAASAAVETTAEIDHDPGGERVTQT
jgi:hypothetical protein